MKVKLMSAHKRYILQLLEEAREWKRDGADIPVELPKEFGNWFCGIDPQAIIDALEKDLVNPEYNGPNEDE